MEHWKTEYASVLDSLHIWSWRNSFFHAPMLVSLALQTMVDITKVISEVSTIYSSKTILPVGVSANEIFAQSSALAALFSTLSSFLLIAGLAGYVSVKFRRLEALVSSLKLPELSRLDFTMMYHETPAYTILDMPIYISTISTCLQIFLVQFVALSVANYSME
jgi:hypothetical protein